MAIGFIMQFFYKKSSLTNLKNIRRKMSLPAVVERRTAGVFWGCPPKLFARVLPASAGGL
jgi:hypothetical protein